MKIKEKEDKIKQKLKTAQINRISKRTNASLIKQLKKDYISQIDNTSIFIKNNFINLRTSLCGSYSFSGFYTRCKYNKNNNLLNRIRVFENQYVDFLKSLKNKINIIILPDNQISKFLERLMNLYNAFNNYLSSKISKISNLIVSISTNKTNKTNTTNTRNNKYNQIYDIFNEIVELFDEYNESILNLNPNVSIKKQLNNQLNNQLSNKELSNNELNRLFLNNNSSSSKKKNNIIEGNISITNNPNNRNPNRNPNNL